MAFRRWHFAKTDKQLSRSIAQKFGIDGFAAHLLSSRGFTSDEDISSMLGIEDDFAEFIDPFSIIDMDKAVERIRRAIDEFEKIAVYGDYDVDGITSTALVFSYLESCGANVTYYIPNRDAEGYGMNCSAVDKLHEMGIQLIVTVDNGISAISEIAHANELGIDVVVTDHHCEGDAIPDAVAVVNPHRHESLCPFTEYAGVGVAFKLVSALDGDSMAVAENYADLVALGTIADVVSLTGENRRLVRFGLEIIHNSERLGLQVLNEMSGLADKTINSSSVAFIIAPRLNAAGRLGNAERAVKLLLTENEDEAVELAEILTAENRERQALEQIINREANEFLKKNPRVLYDRVLVVDGEDWNRGVIGIFASKLCERYGKPCIIISKSGDLAKGSGRSIDGFSLYDAIAECSEYLLGFGGHTLAAGISLKSENIENFRRAINEYAAREFNNMPAPLLNIDCQLPPSAVNIDLLYSAQVLEPFGADNPSPVIAMMGLKITDIFGAGGGRHQKLTLQRDDSILTAMKFSTLSEEFPFNVGDVVDVAATLDKASFRGQESLTVVIRDMRLSETHFDEINDGIRCFEALMRGELSDSADLDKVCPLRNDVVTVYRMAIKGYRGGIDVLCCRLKHFGVSSARLLVSLQILKEGQLIDFENNGLTITVAPNACGQSGCKIALEKTPTAIKTGYLNI